MRRRFQEVVEALWLELWLEALVSVFLLVAMLAVLFVVRWFPEGFRWIGWTIVAIASAGVLAIGLKIKNWYWRLVSPVEGLISGKN